MDEVKEEVVIDFRQFMEKTYCVYYVDYRDNLEDHLSLVQDSVQDPDDCGLIEAVEDWFCDPDYTWEFDQLAQKMAAAIGGLDLAKDYIEDHREEIESAITDKDTSDPLADLIRNTRSVTVFYDMGKYIHDMTYEGPTKRDVYNLRRALQIKGHRYDDKLFTMLGQAGPGNLVLFFQMKVSDLFDIPLNANWLTVDDPIVGIINTTEGSGDRCELEGHRITVPFSRMNLFLDEKGCVVHPYGSVVCGMVHDWAADPKVRFTHGKQRLVERSGISNGMRMEREYETAYRAGKCTHGDMNMSRHRGLYYRNEPFSCGTVCPHCGTFWID